MVFGLAAIPVLAIVGGAVDFTQVHRTKARLQGATDSAAVGAMRARNMTDSQREQLASDLFIANTSSNPATLNAVANVSIANGTAVVETTFPMPTVVLKVVGITSIPLTVHTTVTATGKKIELALMTDITGSMNETRNGQTKIDGLKLAADDLLDLLLPTNAATEDARVSLVPFASYVNAGQFTPAVTGLNPTRNNAGSTEYVITCVTERTGSNAYTDAAPGSSAWIGASTQGAQGASYSADGSCNRPTGGSSSIPLPAMIPLTNDKLALKAQIDSFVAGGSTAGHLGTAWAWYTIAPGWNSVFNLSTPPRPYNDPDYMKFVVLMTDGEYNTQYSAADSKTQALALCAAMKAQGITVFTVGFGFEASSSSDDVARNTLTQCSSGTGHYFFPYDSDALRTAFSQIGNMVTSWTGKVRITQ